MYRTKYYISPRGKCFVKEFLAELPIKVEVKIYSFLELLEKHGPNLPRPYADVVRGKIRELRIGFGAMEYRILYFFFGKKIILTHGFVKKTREVPEAEIARAERIMADYHSR